ncbi:MAG: glucose-6-phosphate dehydrogenase [Erysipelotrichaceae bacterium]
MTGINNRYLVFGSTGDLSKRKLFPAFYNMLINNNLNNSDQIIAFGRKQMTTDEFLDNIKENINAFSRYHYNEKDFENLRSITKYIILDIDDRNQYIDIFKQLGPAKQSIAYLAMAPSFFYQIACNLANSNISNLNIVIEKPFGDTLDDINMLHLMLLEHYLEDNIYYIDHYLGKEMVRNILTIRCANSIFENLWNKQFIEKIEINALEKVAVENRASYYDKTGALKDMVQNHLLQLLTIIALNDPSDKTTLKSQQRTILQSLYYKDIKDSMLLGQYKEYRNEPMVNPLSKTETAASVKLYIDLPQWENIPFVVSTGKNLSEQKTEVKIYFKPSLNHLPGNVLTINIQPTEGLNLSVNVKKINNEDNTNIVNLEFCQSCNLENKINTPESYEWMLEAIKNNEHYWFSEHEQIKTSWLLIEKMFLEYQKEQLDLYFYDDQIRIL